jgi:hypothetical protein
MDNPLYEDSQYKMDSRYSFAQRNVYREMRKKRYAGTLTQELGERMNVALQGNSYERRTSTTAPTSSGPRQWRPPGFESALGEANIAGRLLRTGLARISPGTKSDQLISNMDLRTTLAPSPVSRHLRPTGRRVAR